jgi:hypothetical protein
LSGTDIAGKRRNLGGLRHLALVDDVFGHDLLEKRSVGETSPQCCLPTLSDERPANSRLTGRLHTLVGTKTHGG